MIKWFGDDFSASQDESPSSLKIPWVFNPRDFTWIYYRHCGDQHRLLHAGSNYDLIGIAADSSGIAQVGCDCFAEIGIAQV